MEIFSYHLPAERIAQRPVYPYDAAKLLVIDRQTGHLIEDRFYNIGNYLKPADLLVFNNSKVRQARLFGRLAPGHAAVEVLLLRRIKAASTTNEIWEALARPLRKLTPGRIINFQNNFEAEVQERQDQKTVILELRSTDNLTVMELINQLGCMPIPPYIRKGKGDQQDTLDYQSEFAKIEGSIAAPTASLHFTPDLLKQLASEGLEFQEVTLHVGSASFLPVYQEDPVVQTGASSIEAEVTPPSAEQMFVTEQLVGQINSTRAAGKRVIAVGTTVVRALESISDMSEIRGEVALETMKFIQPGHKFEQLDLVVTNFHQPGTTHMLLVEALLGRELLAKAYQYALEHEFRFLSYGDAMLII
jgi:S-adenosylmethionine:tRNA ribosyltransferase-isomerase